MSEIIERPIDKSLKEDDLEKIEDVLKRGELIVYPTSTLYGLGASIWSEAGLKALWETKSRPAYMPFSVMASKGDIEKLCTIPDMARPFFDTEDTSVTAIFLALDSVPDSVAYKGTLGVRLPCSELTRSLVERTGPLTATSANPHGKGVPAEIAQIKDQLGDDVAIYIDGGALTESPTTLVDFTSGSPHILREGTVSEAEVLRLYGR